MRHVTFQRKPNGAANAAFGAVVVVSNGLHCRVFTVVFESDEKFIADGQVWRLSTLVVQFVVGSLQEVEHGQEDRLGRSE